jgi:hypothetical protein
MRCRDRNPREAWEAERLLARSSRLYFEEEQKLRRVRGILKQKPWRRESRCPPAGSKELRSGGSAEPITAQTIFDTPFRSKRTSRKTAEARRLGFLLPVRSMSLEGRRTGFLTPIEGTKPTGDLAVKRPPDRPIAGRPPCFEVECIRPGERQQCYSARLLRASGWRSPGSKV